MKKHILIILLLLIFRHADAQDFKTVTYFANDSLKLEMDVFIPKTKSKEKLPLLVHVHGGGFSGGDRKWDHAVARQAAAEGSWYTGPTLLSALDKVEVPERPYASPFRIPLSNVFKGQTAVASGVAVQGRLAAGIVQVGDAVRGMPGDVMATIRSEYRCRLVNHV